MYIDANEIKFYKSASTTGGVMSDTLTGYELFPSVPNIDRINGATIYRKAFVKVENAEGLTLANSRVFMWDNTEANDYIIMAPGTASDTTGNFSTPRWYGSGVVTSLNTGTITLTQESTVALFVAGDVCILTNKDAMSSETGNIEFITVNTVSYVGTTATITTVDPIVNTYSSGVISLKSSINLGDIKTSYDNVVKTSLNGTFNPTYLELNNLGTVDETWTITFTGPTNFNVSGARLGLQASGTTTLTYDADNSNYLGYPYFSFLVGPGATPWGGTWATNDTLVFQTHAAAKGVWFKRVVPPNCPIDDANFFSYVVIGDS